MSAATRALDPEGLATFIRRLRMAFVDDLVDTKTAMATKWQVSGVNLALG